MIEALRAGLPVVLPFDTVYGLAAEPYEEESTRRLYELKGRPPTQPTALVAASIDALRAAMVYLLEIVKLANPIIRRREEQARSERNKVA